MVDTLKKIYKELLGNDLECITEMYFNDIDSIDDSYHTNKENLELGIIIRNLVVRLNNYFDELNIYSSGMLIPDKMRIYCEHSDDAKKITEVKKIYEEFISLRNKMADDNLELVLKVAKRFVSANDANINDVIQFGNIGLLKAIENFNPDKHPYFNNYAIKIIFVEIRDNAFRFSTCLSVPKSIPTDCFNLLKLIRTEYEKSGIILDDKEISKLMNLSIHRIQTLKKFIFETKTNDEVDFVYSLFTDIDDILIYEELINKLNSIFEILDSRQVEILKLRNGFYGKRYTLEEVAQLYEVSFQAIASTESLALRKIRNNYPELRDYLNR